MIPQIIQQQHYPQIAWLFSGIFYLYIWINWCFQNKFLEGSMAYIHLWASLVCWEEFGGVRKRGGRALHLFSHIPEVLINAFGVFQCQKCCPVCKCSQHLILLQEKHEFQFIEIFTVPVVISCLHFAPDMKKVYVWPGTRFWFENVRTIYLEKLEKLSAMEVIIRVF